MLERGASRFRERPRRGARDSGSPAIQKGRLGRFTHLRTWVFGPMGPLMNLSPLLRRLMAPGVTPAAIRSEIYFLGTRHRGEALKGAREELKARDLTADRSRLLRAVVNQLQREPGKGA